MDPDELRARVDQIDWYHQIDLGHGIVTPGVDDSPHRLSRLQLPDLTGKTLLDVGAWDGFFSFEAERRRATRVLATDSFAWQGKSWGRKDGFELARQALRSRVEDIEVEVLDLSRTLGTFDVVLFLGVLYHMRHPLLALEKVAALCKEVLIVETVIDMVGFARPAMAHYPGNELAGDDTCYWAPNVPCLEAMLRDVGFRKVTLVTKLPMFWYRAARAPYHALVGRNTCRMAFRQDRVVFHAFK